MVLAGALAAGGMACTERGSEQVPAYECAARPTVTVWDSTVNDETPDAYAVAGDAGGYLLLWTNALTLDAGPVAGLFAARPGGEVHQLVEGQDAMSVVSTDVDDGVLACYWWQYEPCASFAGCMSCIVVRPTLEVAHGPTLVATLQDQDAPWAALVRLEGALFALAFTYVVPDMLLLPLDERGVVQGEPVPLPCRADFGALRSPVAWNDTRLACLVPSDRDCGTQWEEPGCTYSLRVVDERGSILAEVADPAPWIGGLSGAANLVGDGDGFLLAWRDLSPGLAVRAVDNDGSLGVTTVVPVSDLIASGPWLAATPLGYDATWTEQFEPNRYGLRMAVLDRNGAVLAGPSWFAPPTDDVPYNERPVVGTAGGGMAVLWNGVFNDRTFHTRLLFRDFGCDLGALQP